MKQFSCLYFLLVATLFASGSQKENLSGRSGLEKPSLCFINFHKLPVQPVNNAGSQDFISEQNIESTTLASVQVYPNPAKNQVTVYFPLNNFPGGIRISLMNAFGQEVKQALLPASSNTVYLSGLTPGFYVYRIWDQTKIIKTGKLIIE